MAHNIRHHDLVAASILDAAATEFEAHGASASMSDVAARAGVSRATLYNYYASRDDLLRSLRSAAVADAAARLASADLDMVAFDEALRRLTSALVSGGARLSMMMPLHDDDGHGKAESLVRPSIERLFQRGLADGTIPGIFTVETLTSLYIGLLRSAVGLARHAHHDPTDITELVMTLLVEGIAGGR